MLQAVSLTQKLAQAFAQKAPDLNDIGARIYQMGSFNINFSDDDRQRLVEANAEIAKAQRAVKDDHAEVICLGCGGMAGLDRQIEECTGVPVVDGVSAAVALAESLVRLKLKTSKVRTYAPPRPKRIVGWPGTFVK